MRNIFLITFLVFLVWPGKGQANSCQLSTLPEKTDLLKLELICSNSDSLHTCSELIKSYKKSRPIFKEDQPFLTQSDFSQCSSSDLSIGAGATILSKASSQLIEQMGAVENSLNRSLVLSQEDFFKHTELHRTRVRKLGLSLFDSHPDLFSHVSREELTIALAEHDRAKVSAFAKSEDGRSFFRALYEDGYGKRMDRSLVDQLNQADEEYMDKIMKHLGLEEQAHMTEEHKKLIRLKREEILRIEKIADFVDRGMSPVAVEEFGREMDRASSFMQDPKDAKLALELENRYDSVIKGNEYKTPSSSERALIASKIQIDENFVDVVKARGNKLASAHALAHRSYLKAKRGFLKILSTLSTTLARRSFLVVDGILLSFEDMNKLSCDMTPGHHDWVKNPNCQPAIGLTPRIVDFLSLTESQQRDIAEKQGQTCQVIQQTHDLAVKPPKILSCHDNEAELELVEGRSLNVGFNNEGHMKHLNFSDFKDELGGTLFGRAYSATVGEAGELSEVCVESRAERGGNRTHCLKRSHLNGVNSKHFERANEFVQSMNYKIQKGINCCQGARGKRSITDLPFNCLESSDGQMLAIDTSL